MLREAGKVTPYSLRTPEQVSLLMADRIRELRLSRGWRQVTLAERSGVSLASLRRFESSGRISFQNLLKLVFAVGRLDDFETLLDKPRAASLAELEAGHESSGRRRGRV